MRLAILAYVPPPHVGNGKVFLENLKKFPTKNELILYSDYDWPKQHPASFPSATWIPIRNPEMVKNVAGPENAFAINNAVFFTGLRIAAGKGCSHILYVEEDSRVGREHWDDVIFTEFMTDPGLIGGSAVVYNPCNAGPEAARRWMELCKSNTRKNYPIPTYGWKGAADGTGSCVFVNGSLGIYDMNFLISIFGVNGQIANTLDLSTRSRPWDLEIGVRMWDKLGVDTYDAVRNLSSVFSSYGDVLTTEKERLDMVRNGQIVATHQVKSAETV